MTTGKVRSLLFLTAVVIVVLLVFGRSPSTQATSPDTTPAASPCDYKVELVKQNASLEAVLQADARNGWRLQTVEIGPYRNELVVVLKTAGCAP